MIHARIDTVDHRQIVGFEIGNRAQFDRRHPNDPLWVFIESYQIRYRSNIGNFLKTPHLYKADLKGNLSYSTEAPIVIEDITPDRPPVGFIMLTGANGNYLTGEDGLFLYGPDPDYVAPPAGQVYLTEDNTVLTDGDGFFITEPV